MNLGTKEDNTQEDILDDVTQLTVNMNQAHIYRIALLALVENTKPVLNELKRIVSNPMMLTPNQLVEKKEELTSVENIMKSIPYMVGDTEEAIIYLQKEEDAIIKGVQL